MKFEMKFYARESKNFHSWNNFSVSGLWFIQFVWLCYSRVLLCRKIYIFWQCTREQLKVACSLQAKIRPDNISVSISRAFCRATVDSSLNWFVSSRREQCVREANWYVGINIVLSIEIFGSIGFGRSISVPRDRRAYLSLFADRLLRALHPLSDSHAKSRHGGDKATGRPRSRKRDPLAPAFFTLRRSSRIQNSYRDKKLSLVSCTTRVYSRK